jgi:cytoskeletal protein CcmA (bactofilin family)
MSYWNNKQEPLPATRETGPIPAPFTPAVPQHKESFPMATVTREEVPTTPLASSSDLLLGAGAEFEGKLTFKGTVRIDAKFSGSIVTNDVLVVGEHARIDAEITCGTVVVHGEVNGNIKAKNAVEVHRSGKVRGNLETPSLMVEKGSFLQGEVKMATIEKGAAAKPTAAPGAAVLQQ